MCDLLHSDREKLSEMCRQDERNFTLCYILKSICPFTCALCEGVELETRGRFVCMHGTAFGNSIVRMHIISHRFHILCTPFCGVTLIETLLKVI